MSPMEKQARLCGIWADPKGGVHLCQTDAKGSRIESSLDFKPFAWSATPSKQSLELEGKAKYRWLRHFESFKEMGETLERHGKSSDFVFVLPPEHQFLIAQQKRLFANMRIGQLRRCQLSIEVCSSGSFPQAQRAEDRIVAIGLKMGKQLELLRLDGFSDMAEQKLMESFMAKLAALNPDVIEGHNIFNFALSYLQQRFRHLKLPCRWGRFGALATWRPSRLRIAERQIEFKRFDLPGRAVLDTFLAAQFHDIAQRALPSYKLKALAKFFGFARGSQARVEPSRVRAVMESEPERLFDCLEDGLMETESLGGLFLPVYLAQVQDFPMTLQEANLRGSAFKIELLMLERYFQAKHALPLLPKRPPAYPGALTHSTKSGIYKRVLHYDVSSMYPSLLLRMQRGPFGDTLKVFLPLLEDLREKRLNYKTLAQSHSDANTRTEYKARQNAYKILINSFYGYLGFEGGRFSDGALAAEVTKAGRKLLEHLMKAFQEEGCELLEADTDGLYVSSKEYWSKPKALLEKIKADLPAGIELEFDGSFEAMLCYKAKNYALYDGQKVRIVGSALRSRSLEPYLRELTEALIKTLLGAKGPHPQIVEQDFRKRIEQGKFPIEQLAASERLSQSPERYKKLVQAGKKPRRASLEAALQLDPVPPSGSAVKYYLLKGAKQSTPNWQRVRPMQHHDAKAAPYDAKYYLRKLDDWAKRYAELLKACPR